MTYYYLYCFILFSIIVIGGWGNTKSVIRRRKQGPAIANNNNTTGINNLNTYVDFTVDWDGSTLKVSKEGLGQFLQFTDTQSPLNLGFLGFTTGWGSTGDFEFFGVNPLTGNWLFQFTVANLFSLVCRNILVFLLAYICYRSLHFM